MTLANIGHRPHQLPQGIGNSALETPCNQQTDDQRHDAAKRGDRHAFNQPVP